MLQPIKLAGNTNIYTKVIMTVKSRWNHLLLSTNYFRDNSIILEIALIKISDYDLDVELRYFLV